MTSPPPTASAVHFFCQAQHNSQNHQTNSEGHVEALPLLPAGDPTESLGFKRTKPSMALHFWTLLYIARRRDGLEANQQIWHWLFVWGEQGCMRDVSLLRNLSVGFWSPGCLGMSMPALSLWIRGSAGAGRISTTTSSHGGCSCSPSRSGRKPFLGHDRFPPFSLLL